MRVRALIYHRDTNEHPQGYKRGDIVEIAPMSSDLGRLWYDTFYPVDMDLDIPCGVEFEPPYKCKDCVNNHPDTCDVRKLKTAEWELDGPLNWPKLVKQRIHGVNLEALIPENLKTAAYKTENTEQEKSDILAYADSELFQKNIIIDKTELTK